MVLACEGYDFWKEVVDRVPVSSEGRRVVLDKFSRDVMCLLCFKGKDEEVRRILEAYIKWKGEASETD